MTAPLVVVGARGMHSAVSVCRHCVVFRRWAMPDGVTPGLTLGELPAVGPAAILLNTGTQRVVAPLTPHGRQVDG